MIIKKKDVRSVVKRLAKAMKVLAEKEDDDEVRPTPKPSATETEIERFEKYASIKLPPSYHAFLELHNGYDWLVYRGHMLSTIDMMPGSKSYERIQKWKKDCLRYGGSEVANGIVIADHKLPNEWTYIDPSKPLKDGEFTIVNWTPSCAEEYSNLVEFFKENIAICQEDVDSFKEEKRNKR